MVVDELARVIEGWVRGSTVGGEGLDEELQQPERDCADWARR
jgi:hypothetical protein